MQPELDRLFGTNGVKLLSMSSMNFRKVREELNKTNAFGSTKSDSSKSDTRVELVELSPWFERYNENAGMGMIISEQRYQNSFLLLGIWVSLFDMLHHVVAPFRNRVAGYDLWPGGAGS